MQQYTQLDPTKPPQPRYQDGLDVEADLDLYADEEKPRDTRLGVFGTAKMIFRALGFGKDETTPKPEMPKSTKVARSKRMKGLFEK